jgi:hypothetical protein
MPLFTVNNNCPNLIALIVLTHQKKVFAMFRSFLDDKMAINLYLVILSSRDNLCTAKHFWHVKTIDTIKFGAIVIYRKQRHNPKLDYILGTNQNMLYSFVQLI